MNYLVPILILSMIAPAILVWIAQWLWGWASETVEWLPGCVTHAKRWANVWRAWTLVLALILGIGIPLVGFTDVVIAGSVFLLVGLYFSVSKPAAERRAREYHWMRRAHCGMCGEELPSAPVPPGEACSHCGWTLALPKSKRS